MLLQRQKEFVEKQFSGERYAHLIERLQNEVGMEIPWRACETSAFFSRELQQQLEEAAIHITVECTSDRLMEITKAAIEDKYNVPNEAAKPLFATVDFAICGSEEEGFYPKLIEMQGFPSVYGFKFLFGKASRDIFGLDDVTHILGGHTEEEYLEHLKTAILGGYEPDEVCLLEYKPKEQKTRPDFLATEGLLGVQETDICEVKKEGRTLLHLRNGEWKPIRRIYNRAIVDELEDNKASLPFDWTDDIDVEWAGHPNWYFRMSKYTLPFLTHESVPKTIFLDTIEAIPDDLENYVLKPLFAFAGKGVIIDPTAADIEAVPPEQRSQFVLQEKVRYAEALYTPEGMNKVEARIMLLWLDGEAAPCPMIGLIRTGRGPMMGVRYNSIPWTGSAAIFVPKAD